MRNQRDSMERRVGGEMSVAVAIDKDKTSQYALKWAVDNIVNRDQTLKLIHVKDRPPSPLPSPGSVRPNDETPAEQHGHNQTMDMLLPFRCYCRRTQVQCETVILEDPDVAKALIEYVCQHGVGTLLLGTASKNSLTRLFKTNDIPGSVLKWAPDFCTVYVISKGKISSVRNATRPIPAISAVVGTPFGQRNSSVESSLALENGNWYDELAANDSDVPTASPESPSADNAGFTFYQNLGSGIQDCPMRSNTKRMTLPCDPSSNSIVESEHLESSSVSKSRTPSPLTALPLLNRLDSAIPSLSILNAEDHEVKISLLETELKQTMIMYHAACREALAAKQKAVEVEQWKMKEEKRLRETYVAGEESALSIGEREKEKCKKAAIEAAEKVVEIEVQKRVEAELKALREAKEKDRVLEALGQSHMALKYQSLFHMVAVLFLFYFYFSIFR